VVVGFSAKALPSSLASDIPMSVHDRPLKILQVSRVYWPNLGGMEKIAQGLAEHLVQRGHRCDVVTLDRSFEDGSAYPPYSEHNGVNVYRVPFKGSTRYPIAPRVARFAGRYDLLHVHGVDFLLDWMVLNKARHGKPIVLSTHGGFFHTAFAQKWKKVWFQTMTRATLRGVDRVLASSEHDLGVFEKVSDRCELVRNAVDLSTYKTLKNKPEPGRWVCVGRVDVHKGIAHLLDSLAALKAMDERPFQMHIIGPVVVDGLLADLEAKRDALGLNASVHFEGRIEFDALHALVERAELAIFPSEYEAFGISVVEAMGASVLPVLNDIEPFRHFVQPGENGFLADFKEPQEAAAVLREARNLSASQRKRMTKAAKSKALEYDWESTVSRFESLYREVLSAHVP
jgi:alpha-1,3-mannosyltransferase